jgi:hypothetical protein
MAAALLLLICSFYLAAQEQPAPPADPPPAQRTNLPKKKDRYAWMALLRDDVNSALSRANLDKNLKKTVEKHNTVITHTVADHQNKKKVDQAKVDKALVGLYNSFTNRAFSEADRAYVMEDLENLPMKAKEAKAPRPRNPRAMGPRPRRYPRY